MTSNGKAVLRRSLGVLACGMVLAVGPQEASAETFVQRVRSSIESRRAELVATDATITERLMSLSDELSRLKTESSLATKALADAAIRADSASNVVEKASAKQSYNSALADSTKLSGRYKTIKRQYEDLTSEKSSVERSLGADISMGAELSRLNGTDEFSTKLVDEALRYYGGYIHYSQGTSRGQVSFSDGVASGYLDCSSFVTMVMRASGMNVSIGSTETLFSYNGTILKEISRDEATTGDIFVVGTPGSSLGQNGHTGIFLDPATVIHCSSWGGDNGGGGSIYIENYPSHHYGLEPHFYRIVR